MENMRRIAAWIVAWVAAITGLHAWLNVDWDAAFNDYLPEGRRKLNVAYIPVT